LTQKIKSFRRFLMPFYEALRNVREVTILKAARYLPVVTHQAKYWMFSKLFKLYARQVLLTLSVEDGTQGLLHRRQAFDH
jgi:hypothetical protein